MKRVQFWWGVLDGREFESGNLRGRRYLERCQNIRNNDQLCMKRRLRNGKDVRRLRRNHPFAAIMTLIRGIARHRTATLHGLLVESHRRRAIYELQKQYRCHGKHQKLDSPNHSLQLYEH